MNYFPLNPFDLYRVSRLVPKKVARAMSDYGVFLAGGFIRSVITGEEINDMDFFVRYEKDVEPFTLRLKEALSANCVVHTTNAITLVSKPYPAQIVTRWKYLTADDLIAAFDFTVCQSVVWCEGEKWDSIRHPAFYEDLAAKRLIYTSPVREEAPGGSFIRALKYGRRGYRMPMKDWSKVIDRMAASIPADLLVDASGRRDALATLLQEVDPQVDPRHDVHEAENALEGA